jgi:hypothetical protein
VRFQVHAIVPQHKLKPICSLLDGGLVAAVGRSEQRAQRESEWRECEQVEQRQATSTQPAKGLWAAPRCCSVELHAESKLGLSAELSSGADWQTFTMNCQGRTTRSVVPPSKVCF